jgi:hypothetical protein
MQWLTDLLKHFSTGKSVTFAGMIASGVIVFGPYYFQKIPQVQAPWLWVPIVVFIFTTVLCALQLISYVYHCFLNAWSLTEIFRFHRFLDPLSKDEETLLAIIANNGGYHTDLESLFRGGFFPVKLKLLAISEKLQKRGYVQRPYRDEDMVRLTPRGRAFVLKKYHS